MRLPTDTWDRLSGSARDGRPSIFMDMITPTRSSRMTMAATMLIFLLVLDFT
jgi:hypothetical protein